MGDDELAMLDGWRAGDVAAGQALFERHFAAIYRFFASKVDGDVEDLVQKTFLECVRGRESFRGQSSFRTFVFAVARHVLYHHWRDRARRAAPIDFDEVSVASLSTTAGSRLIRREDAARLLDALRALPLEQQLLLELHYWEDLDGDALAEVFGIAAATTRSRLYRARAALRDELTRAPAPGGEVDFEAWARSLAPELVKVRNARGERGTTKP